MRLWWMERVEIGLGLIPGMVEEDIVGVRSRVRVGRGVCVEVVGEEEQGGVGVVGVRGGMRRWGGRGMWGLFGGC